MGATLQGCPEWVAMLTMRVLLARLRAYWAPTDRDRDLRDEIQAHLNQLESAYIAHGMSPDDARLAARKAFGGVDQVRAASAVTCNVNAPALLLVST